MQLEATQARHGVRAPTAPEAPCGGGGGGRGVETRLCGWPRMEEEDTSDSSSAHDLLGPSACTSVSFSLALFAVGLWQPVSLSCPGLLSLFSFLVISVPEAR